MILNHKGKSLNRLIEYIHGGDKYPQFHNIAITNMQNNVAYKYDSKKKTFVATTKKELLDDVLLERANDIEDFLDVHFDSLSGFTKKVLNETMEKLQDDDNFRNDKLDQIKMIIYNNNNDIKKYKIIKD
jgi:aryl carrier-like protein